MRALLLLALPGMAHADLSKGAHVGASVAGIEANRDMSGGGSGDDVDAPFLPGIVIGAYIRKHFTPSFSMQFEGHVEHKRAFAINCQMTGACSETGDIGLWYFAVPVMLRFDLLPGATKFHLHGGPELVLTLGGGQTDRMTDTYQRFDSLVPGNLGIAIGTGVEFATGPGAITLDFRYKRWFAPVSDEGDDKVELTHQLWLVTGYVFP